MPAFFLYDRYISFVKKCTWDNYGSENIGFDNRKTNKNINL